MGQSELLPDKENRRGKRNQKWKKKAKTEQLYKH